MNKILLCVLILCALTVPVFRANARQTSQQKPVALHGRVVDARTGEPIAKVRVVAGGGDQSTTTDEKGEFSFENLAAGEVVLYITTVNYGLVKKTIVLKQGENPDIRIALNEDAAALTEKVTVIAGPYETAQTNVATEQTLNKRELQSLSSILLGDPVRAAHALPGSTTNDDFRSEFAVRGAGFDRIGLYVDGILTEDFVHAIQGGYADTGSLSVINADTVNELSLMSGAFPTRYGDRSGGILDIETRDGNRVKPAGRISASLSALSGVVDGPFANGRGSYLFAGRKSYLGYVLRRVNDQQDYTNNPPILEFSDFQGKALYDLTNKSQVGASVILGSFDFDRNRDPNLLGINNVLLGESRNLLFNSHWNYTPNPKIFSQTRVFVLRTNFKNTNRNNTALQDGERTQYGVRNDFSFTPNRRHRIDAGLYIRRLNVDSFDQFFDFSTGTLRNRGSFNQSGTEQAYYVQDTWTSEGLGLSLTGGGRFEISSTTGETLFSPRGSAVWSINKDWRVRAAAGRYYQFPNFDQVYGRLANPRLKAEAATHYNVSVERRFGTSTRFLVEVYDREDDGLFFSLSEPRMVGNVPTFTEFPFQNSLHGHARGFEVTLQRRSANKLTGWVSYAYSRTKLTDSQTGLTFVSDVDQRHTLNAYGSYRFNETWNLSSEWRYGSGQPVPGFYRQAGNSLNSTYFLTNVRNTTRLPSYNRLDIRVNKAFLFEKWKLTLSGEVINVTNSNNRRYAGFDGYGFDGRVFGQLDRVLPFLPSAGVVVEF
jgi:outer membrane cobalamin receptor